ncbi:hypothetical protein BLOT_013464 [Blomia tropicalis]|nr:hypothetical protein BLOT_013464 [Blomia tropicalis]
MIPTSDHERSPRSVVNFTNLNRNRGLRPRLATSVDRFNFDLNRIFNSKNLLTRMLMLYQMIFGHQHIIPLSVNPPQLSIHELSKN